MGARTGRSGRTGRSRLLGLVLALAATLAAALPAAALTAAAAPAGEERADGAGTEELGLRLSTGHDGHGASGDWLPVEATLEPRRPVAATLEVAVAGTAAGRMTISREVEVQAGSRSAFRFVVPNGAVRVRVVEADREPVTVELDVRPPEAGFLVGVLGQLPAQLPPVRVEPAGLDGTWVGVEPEWLALGREAVAPLGTLVATVNDLEAVPVEDRRALAAAVVAGTDLVVVAQDDGPVDLTALGLPGDPASSVTGETVAVSRPGWTLTAGQVFGGAPPDGLDAAAVVAAVAPAGRGRVTVVAAGPGEGATGTSSAFWSALVGPGTPEGSGDSPWSFARNPAQFARLLADGERGVPTVPWLAAFLVAYVLVVGPANGLILARLRRRELAWITVPVVTVVFTGTALLSAVGGRPPVGVGARAAYWVEGVGAELTAAGVQAPTAGTRTVQLPGEGWTVRPMVDGGQRSALRRGADTEEVALDLVGLQFGGVLGARPLPAPAPLDVAAVATRDGVEVRVTNDSGQLLQDVHVVAGTWSSAVGELAAGATWTEVVGEPRLRQENPYRDLLDGLDRDADGAAEAPAALEALLRTELMDGNPALVWVVGTTSEATSGVAVEGDPAEDAGTLYAVAVRARLPPDGTVTPPAVGRALVAAGAEAFRPSPLAVEGPGEAVLRFRFPPGATLDLLHEDLDRGDGPSVELGVWDWGIRQWVPRAEAFPGGAGDPARFLSPLGEVFVRATGDLFPFDFSGRSVSGVDVRT